MFTLHNGDCLQFQPPAFDVIITDPPYPNYLSDEYKYFDGLLDFLNLYTCRQFVFWTVTKPFPLSYTARHEWNKQTGSYATKEYIYERNGESKEYSFSYQKIKNLIDAQMNRDIMTGHPSQKPLRLMKAIITKCNIQGVIYDPFMGSGSTGVAALQMGRGFIGCELSPEYFAIAERRIKQAALQQTLFTPSNNRLHWTGGDSSASPSQSTLEGFTPAEQGTTPAPRQ
jgi:DNA modification methylase